IFEEIIMAFGSWLGPNSNGGLPSHPCSWSRIQMGFASPIIISSNIDSQTIQEVKSSGEIYRLWTSGNISNEYFLVENRQKTGYDTYIPASGLQIWHIDDNISGNDLEWWPGLSPVDHFQVAMEQADGLFELEHANDYGDGNDVFPGTLNIIDFNAVSTTNSDSYNDGVSFVSVENISSSSPTMYADFKVAFASDINDNNNNNLPVTVDLSQNYPNPFNPTTNISFNSSVSSQAKVEVFNVLGQKIKTLLDGYVSAGITSISWDGTDNSGNIVATGMYFYRLEIDEYEEAKKMMFVR
ncbi:MAG: FlgD immunoglobulin-like domain containing protein, partial [Candidatus Zixiibacteriota bacterium]